MELHRKIFEELKKLRDDKGLPVVVSMGNMAASGGYYAAMGAEYVYAYEGTVTGSIGVLMNLFNTEKFLENIGLDVGSITSGKFKNVPNMTRQLTEQEEQYLQETVDSMYQQFLDAVIDNRQEALTAALKDNIEAAKGMQFEEISREILEEYVRENIADGRIFTGRQALAAGLIDEIGTYSDAVNKARELANLDSDSKVKKMKKNPTFLEVMSGEAQAITENLKPEFTFQYRVWF